MHPALAIILMAIGLYVTILLHLRNARPNKARSQQQPQTDKITKASVIDFPAADDRMARLAQKNRA